jgi:hypothetical protein
MPQRTIAVEEILQQVEAELCAMIVSGDQGQITIHFGSDQLVVKVNRERRLEPVRIEKAHLNIIRRPTQ